mgnify:CR=1 FL=1
MFDCILLMAGTGSRTSLDINKVLYKVDDKYLFEYPLNEFLKLKECSKIILVVRNDELITLEPFRSPRILITVGGEQRQDSVANGMKLASEDIVLIHDAARYNINSDDILNVYQATKEYQVAVLATKITDTIKIVRNYKAIKTLDRELLWAMQTPQGVNRQLYLEVITKAKQDNYYGTDDVGLIERYGNVSPQIVPGKGNNFKLTNYEDISLCETIIRSRKDV